MPTRSSAQTQAHGAARPTRRRRCRSHRPITSNTRLPHANEIIHAGTRAAIRARSASSPNPAISINDLVVSGAETRYAGPHDAPDALFACRLAALARLRRERAWRRARSPSSNRKARAGFTPKPLVKAKQHMVVAAHPLAAEAGLAILRKGGSAVDAGIATQMVLNLVEPQSSGIGGGGYHSLLGRRRQAARKHRRPRDRARRRHARALPRCGRQAAAARRGHGERAFGRRPRRARRAEARPRQIRQAALGGAVRAGHRACPRRFPHLAPPRQAARRGRPAKLRAGSARLFLRRARQALARPATSSPIRRSPTRSRRLPATDPRPSTRATSPTTSPARCKTIRASLASSPLEDFASYRANEREPICAPYRAHQGLRHGPVLLRRRRRGAGARHRRAVRSRPRAAWRARRASDRRGGAARSSPTARAISPTPDFVAVPVAGLLDPTYLAERRALIDPDRALANVAAGSPPEHQAGRFRQRSHARTRRHQPDLHRRRRRATPSP